MRSSPTCFDSLCRSLLILSSKRRRVYPFQSDARARASSLKSFRYPPGVNQQCLLQGQNLKHSICRTDQSVRITSWVNLTTDYTSNRLTCLLRMSESDYLLHEHILSILPSSPSKKVRRRYKTISTASNKLGRSRRPDRYEQCITTSFTFLMFWSTSQPEKTQYFSIPRPIPTSIYKESPTTAHCDSHKTGKSRQQVSHAREMSIERDLHNAWWKPHWISKSETTSPRSQDARILKPASWRFQTKAVVSSHPCQAWFYTNQGHRHVSKSHYSRSISLIDLFVVQPTSS
jgi:hypothetical protein